MGIGMLSCLETAAAEETEPTPLSLRCYRAGDPPFPLPREKALRPFGCAWHGR